MKKLRKWLVSKIAPKSIIIIYAESLPREGSITLNYKLGNKKVEECTMIVNSELKKTLSVN